MLVYMVNFCQEGYKQILLHIDYTLTLTLTTICKMSFVVYALRTSLPYDIDDFVIDI